MRRLLDLLVFGLSALCAIATVAAHQEPRDQGTLLDRLLSGYLDGDSEIVPRTLHRSQEFHQARIADPRRLDRWLGDWRRAKAAVLLEVADVSTRVAPQYTRPLLSAGRRYISKAENGKRLGSGDNAFVRLWHRAAIGILQRSGSAELAEEYLDALEAERSQQAPAGPRDDPRFVLARAIAQEQRCWFSRPILDRPDTDLDRLMRAASMSVRDPGAPSKDRIATLAELHQACLRDALTLFKTAAAADDTRAEAEIRGGWTLLQLDNSNEALQWLDRARPQGDSEAAYWAVLFRARVLESLQRFDDAAAAYRDALAICPTAQSASIGLSLALFRTDRVSEADEVARALRASPATAHDPWWSYATADHRFVAQWLTELRALAR